MISATIFEAKTNLSQLVRQAQIERAIDEMESDPMTGDVIPLKGSEWKGRSRKRVGGLSNHLRPGPQAMSATVSAILIRSEKTYR